MAKKKQGNGKVAAPAPVEKPDSIEVPVNDAQLRILRAANQRYLQKKQEAELARRHVEELKAILASGYTPGEPSENGATEGVEEEPDA